MPRPCCAIASVVPPTPVPTVVEPGTVLKGSTNQAFLGDFGGECRPLPDSYQYAADGRMAAAAQGEGATAAIAERYFYDRAHLLGEALPMGEVLLLI